MRLEELKKDSINLYLVLCYKTGTQITKWLNKFDRKDLADKLKPYDSLTKEQVIEICRLVATDPEKAGANSKIAELNAIIHFLESGTEPDMEKIKVAKDVQGKAPIEQKLCSNCKKLQKRIKELEEENKALKFLHSVADEIEKC